MKAALVLSIQEALFQWEKSKNMPEYEYEYKYSRNIPNFWCKYLIYFKKRSWWECYVGKKIPRIGFVFGNLR